MTQIELTKGPLLDEKGNLTEAGFSTSLVKDYSRALIKACSLRIKEWDYYFVGTQTYGVALTIADNSYVGLGSISIMNFETGFWKTKSQMTFMPRGKTHFPSSSTSGDVSFNHKNLRIDFFNDGQKRRLIAHFDNFIDNRDFDCDITLKEMPVHQSMVIATPFNRPRHFYYNQKINNLQAIGRATVGGEEFSFSGIDSQGVLDWGRGVWTYKNTWYWSSLSGLIDGHKIGFNLGYGFGDTSKATENMLFLDGKAYKTGRVMFIIPKDEHGKFDYLSPWRFTSGDEKVELTFVPILDRHDDTDAIIIKSLQHQVFGRFSGKLVFDERIIEIKDLLGFAERVTNYW
ncbi:MAG: DUF2804 domain-containing protein [Bacilli bacterium]